MTRIAPEIKRGIDLMGLTKVVKCQGYSDNVTDYEPKNIELYQVLCHIVMDVIPWGSQRLEPEEIEALK